MNTVVSKLSVRAALSGSISFLADFLKQHWLIVVLYVVVASAGGFVLKDTDYLWELPGEKLAQLSLLSIVSAFLAFLMPYYGISMAVGKLDPTAKAFSKGLWKSLWQLFCVSLLMAIIGTPLLILFLIPGIWWFIKSSVSCVNLLSTDDGPIASIKKSHELMNNRFWQCFGFLFLTGLIVFIVNMIITGSVGLCLFVGGLLHLAFDADTGINKIANVFRTIGAVISIFTAIIFYYIQAWLYVYLKNNPIGQNISIDTSA